MSDSNSPAAPDENAKKAIALLGARPPLPPTPQEAGWTWTPEKLKAVYLEAFTDIQKSQIAEMVGVDPKTLYKWRTQGDYKRYMAELVYSDGMAEKVQRNKTRKEVADKLLVVILDKLGKPGALAGEKVSALIKVMNDLMISIGEDVAGWEKATAQALAGKPVKQDGSDMAEYIRTIEDPAERETVRRHLLQIFKAHIDARASRETPDATDAIDTEAIPGELAEDEGAATETPQAETRPDELSADDLE